MDHHIIGMVFHAPALVPAHSPAPFTASLYGVCIWRTLTSTPLQQADYDCWMAATAAGDDEVDVDDDRTKKMNNKKTRSIWDEERIWNVRYLYST